MSQEPWVDCPSVDIDLDAPLETRFTQLPRESVAESLRLLDSIMRDAPPSIAPVADIVCALTQNRFTAETHAIATALDRPWKPIMLANVSYDLTLASMGCSTAAMATADGPVLARNLDWWPEDLLARSSVLLRYGRGGKLSFAIAGFAGGIGAVSGWSARGFAFALNAVMSAEGVILDGYPVLLMLRRVLEDASDFDDAVRLLSETPLAAAALLTVVGRENDQRVCVERTPTRAAVRTPDGDAPLITTNDYRLLKDSADPDEGMRLKQERGPAGAIYMTACDRYDSLTALCREHGPTARVPDEFFLRALSNARVKQGITAQHMVIRPRTGQFRLAVPREFMR